MSLERDKETSHVCIVSIESVVELPEHKTNKVNGQVSLVQFLPPR